MTAREIYKRAFRLLKNEFGDEAARNVCLNIQDELTAHAPKLWEPAGSHEQEYCILIIGANCEPAITGKIDSVRSVDPEVVLLRFERETIPQIRRFWKRIACPASVLAAGE